MAVVSEKYPARERFYAHRFCRLLTKAAAAQEIGPEACWLLTVVAHQEDSKRYSGPVTYWNEQLMPLCGFGGRRRIVLARQKAIDAGWLHYEPGGKHKAGLYWTLIPDRFANVNDGPMDEDSDTFCRTEIARQRESSRSETEHQTEHQTERLDSSRSETTAKPERQTCADRNGKRALTGTANVHHSTLDPNPNPNPGECARTRSDNSRKENQGYKIPDSLRCEEFTSAWTDFATHVHELRGRPMGDIRANELLMACQRTGLPKAIADLRFSIEKDSWKILDSSVDFTTPRAAGPNETGKTANQIAKDKFRKDNGIES